MREQTATEMIRRRPIRDAEAYHRVYRQWVDDTAYLRNRAVRLMSLYPTPSILINKDGTLGATEPQYPPEVAAQLAELNRQMMKHAEKLGLKEPDGAQGE
jgi:hypothetical protein